MRLLLLTLAVTLAGVTLADTLVVNTRREISVTTEQDANDQWVTVATTSTVWWVDAPNHVQGRTYSGSSNAVVADVTATFTNALKLPAPELSVEIPPQ